MSKDKLHVALLAGGLSPEREVSLDSAKSVNDALVNLGHQVTFIDVGRNVCQDLLNAQPDVAFNALHGTYGEDGCIQGLLEILDIPYTHSGVLASASAMDKEHSKSIFAHAGLLCPEGISLNTDELQPGKVFDYPYVIKPTNQGSSVGVHIIKNSTDEANLLSNNKLATHKRVIIERYIEGKELGCAVIGEKAMGVIELKPNEGFYDYRNKYTNGKTLHIMPADIPPDIYQQSMDYSLKAHQILGCRGLSRCDFRYDNEGDGKLYLLELNTHPGFTKLSTVPEIASHSGMSFDEIVQLLIEDALCQR